MEYREFSKKKLLILHNLCKGQKLNISYNMGDGKMNGKRNVSRREFLRGGSGLLATVAAGGLMTKANKAFAQQMPNDAMMRQITSSFVTTDPAAFVHPTLATGPYSEDVGARLLCVFDASGSVSDAEYAVQLRATASAVASQDFRDAVFFRGGPDSIALAFMSFGTTCDIEIPWADIRRGEDHKLQEISNEVLSLGRRETGSTHHTKALFYANLCFQNCPWQGDRSIVDFMTDGKDNDSLQPHEELIRGAVRQLGIDHRATVNSLITVDPSSSDADLEDWANQNLVTPPGIVSAAGQYVTPGFNQVVAFERSEESERAIVLYERTMQTAFKEKLIREVAGISQEDYQIRRFMQEQTGGSLFAPLRPQYR